jgi:uncharacterized damage-inducible protein DinB
MDLLDRLLDHDRWATETLLGVCRELDDAQLDQEFDIGHRTLRATFVHEIENIEGWTALMIRQPPQGPPQDTSIPSLTEWHARMYDTFATFARQIREEQRFDDTFSDFYDYPMTFGGGILHVVLHNDEHRTEVVHILSRLGLPEVPEVDHGLWDFKRRGLGS